MYVWGKTWESAKTQAECYHYLFDAAVKMWEIGVDPSLPEVRVAGNVPCCLLDWACVYPCSRVSMPFACCFDALVLFVLCAALDKKLEDACCGGGAGVDDGFRGVSGVAVDTAAVVLSGVSGSDAPLPSLTGIKQVLLDIEGTTTPITFVTETLFPYAKEKVRASMPCRWWCQS